jgi:broad specificity phosphatase PhoE
MKPTRIALVRHGQVHNPEYLLYGRLPGFHLNRAGRGDAERAARLLQTEPLAAIFSSPLERAMETAHAIAHLHPDIEVQPSDLITEVYTPFEGRPAAEADARQGDVYTGSTAPFEQPENIRLRLERFFRQVRQSYPERHVVAVTHGDVILFMALWARGLAVSAENKVCFSRLNILDSYPDTGSITTFSFRTDSPLERPELSYVVPR